MGEIIDLDERRKKLHPEDFEISGGEGVTFGFDTLQKKREFLRTLENMVTKTEEIKQKDYTCGKCAAFPCFRSGESELIDGPFMIRYLSEHPEKIGLYRERIKQEMSQKAGLCFQLIRECRQECDNYGYKNCPGEGGNCKLDGQQVDYNQECHITEHKSQNLRSRLKSVLIS